MYKIDNLITQTPEILFSLLIKEIFMTCLLSGPTKRATDVYGGERRALPEELLATLSHRRVSHGAAPSRRRSTHARRGAAGSRRGGNRVRRAIMGAGNRRYCNTLPRVLEYVLEYVHVYYTYVYSLVCHRIPVVVLRGVAVRFGFVTKTVILPSFSSFYAR